jgi:hypothetical protein
MGVRSGLLSHRCRDSGNDLEISDFGFRIADLANKRIIEIKLLSFPNTLISESLNPCIPKFYLF